MANMLGGGGPPGAPPGGNGAGFLQSLLGGLPDPLGIHQLLGMAGQSPQGQGMMPPPMPGQPPVNFAPQGPPQSGVSGGAPQAFQYSPMSPSGFRVGGGR